MLELIMDFVRDNETCFDRNLKAGHLTGSAWIIDRDRSHALLTHHARLGIWAQLGGHVEDDPDMLNAAWREAREESGLDCVRPVSTYIFDVDVHEIPATPKAPSHFHYDIRFLFEADRDAKLTVSAESKFPRSRGRSPSCEWFAKYPPLRRRLDEFAKKNEIRKDLLKQQIQI